MKPFNGKTSEAVKFRFEQAFFLCEFYGLIIKSRWIYVRTVRDKLGEAGAGLPQLAYIDLIGNRKLPSYYQYVIRGKSKAEIFVWSHPLR